MLYEIVKAGTTHELAKHVAVFLAKGYIPQGSLCYSSKTTKSGESYNHAFSQALILNKES